MPCDLEGSVDYWELLRLFLSNPALGCGIPWHHTTQCPLLSQTTPAPGCDLFGLNCLKAGIVLIYVG